MKGVLGALAFMLAGVVVLFWALAQYGKSLPPPPSDNRTVTEKIRDACKREYPYREDLQNGCIIRAADRVIRADDAAKMDRVLRDAR